MQVRFTIMIVLQHFKFFLLLLLAIDDTDVILDSFIKLAVKHWFYLKIMQMKHNINKYSTTNKTYN